jgi:aspartate aminotransferase
VLTPEDIAGIADILRERPGVFVLSDEIYSRMLYDSPFASIASEPGLGPDDRTIILDGFSKTYAMTGWRLGYGVMPIPLAEHVAKLQVNSNSCTNAATQHAGLEALAGPQDGVDAMLAEFRARRDLIVAGLNELPGVDCITPRGAFYAFPRITDTGYAAHTLADLLLEEAGVACLSGTAFGRYGEGHLRLSYANSRVNIALALEHMHQILSRTHPFLSS